MVECKMKGFYQQFTANEIKEAENHRNPTLVFAEKFSMKEAVIKCLQTEIRDLKEIEIIYDEKHLLRVNLYDYAKKIAESRMIKEILVSVSYENEYITAMAVAQ